MFVLVYDNQISGYADSDIGLPNGFTSYEMPNDTRLDDLFFADNKIHVKPPKPTDNAYWANQINQWVVPAPPSIPMPDTANNPLAIAVKAKIAEKDPFLAEVLGYILARATGDNTLANQQLETLMSMIDD